MKVASSHCVSNCKFGFIEVQSCVMNRILDNGITNKNIVVGRAALGNRRSWACIPSLPDIILLSLLYFFEYQLVLL